MGFKELCVHVYVVNFKITLPILFFAEKVVDRINFNNIIELKSLMNAMLKGAN
jgi:hypothetical protein